MVRGGEADELVHGLVAAEELDVPARHHAALRVADHVDLRRAGRLEHAVDERTELGGGLGDVAGCLDLVARRPAVVEGEDAVPVVGEQRRERLPRVGHVREGAVHEHDRVRVSGRRPAVPVVRPRWGRARDGASRRGCRRRSCTARGTLPPPPGPSAGRRTPPPQAPPPGARREISGILDVCPECRDPSGRPRPPTSDREDGDEPHEHEQTDDPDSDPAEHDPGDGHPRAHASPAGVLDALEREVAQDDRDDPRDHPAPEEKARDGDAIARPLVCVPVAPGYAGAAAPPG